MIKPKYGVKCLHLGFDRYKRYYIVNYLLQ